MEWFREDFSGEERRDEALSSLRYEECSFSGCTFANVRLTDVAFINCTFQNCTLRSAEFRQCVMMNGTFTGSSLIGIDWSGLRRSGRLFPLLKTVSGCLIKYGTFAGMKLAKTDFSGSEFFDCYFQKCGLASCDFRRCEFENTVFEDCDLSRADFRDALRYSINIQTNRISKARFSASGLAGLLGGLDIRIEP